MGQGSYIKTSSGKAARKPNAHRLLAAMTRQILKGMSAATARVWPKGSCFGQAFGGAKAWHYTGRTEKPIEIRKLKQVPALAPKQPLEDV